ncbi:3-isopropylmalate dehydratase small subunit [Pseudobacillus badius]|uniref:3-isopropylmalate dehydratase small subunit n=1 Tax=Bacillus badius TaxID=1455 RepID=UPI0005971E97|nr:3-isopropylmalate dehydratase small subunit [Bacillus badius]KIL73025.1 3-isopropylmalate dehydratase small subunit [Bacillus badius]KZO01156.1 3-isopropylmalate dehydratase small subunit [Bacillus badius]KZR59029.1 3-isopropylmalate dehydratase small subunit [Bacillus badius]MED0667698.1 3-isopropylmalate dehydratase small subunit [Bacillus badius]OCS89335.1 3-isopropylmalate dehydratase small subunit [Bacillus badius]
MEAINKFNGIVCPLNRVNVDTDQIIPKQFLKRIERQGFGQFLFHHWRFDDDGNKREDFIMNQMQYEQAEILVAGENFGCGSSREHAPWALLDYGFRVVIAPSFADIFYNNCVKNGILAIRLTEAEVSEIMEKAKEPGYRLFINLKDQDITDRKGFAADFDIDPYWKQMLLNGWDEIAVTLNLEDEISSYEKKAESIS